MTSYMMQPSLLAPAQQMMPPASSFPPAPAAPVAPIPQASGGLGGLGGVQPQQGGIGGFLNSPTGGNLMQAIGMSLLSSPRNNPFGNLPTVLPALQDRTTAVEDRQRKLASENATVRYLMGKGLTEEEARAVASNPSLLNDWLKQKTDAAAGDEFFGTPIYVQDENGNVIPMQMSKSGKTKPVDLGGNKLAPPTTTVNTQTEQIIMDRFGNVIGRMPIENRTAARDAALGKGEGEHAAELPMLRSKAISSLDALDAQRSVVESELDRAISDIQANPGMTTGLVGGLAAAIPGSPAYGLAKKLETIKANVGFDKLQSMRENSPTGGALGQVSDFENRQLQAVFGNLEQAQTAEQLLFNLNRLKEILANSKDARRRAFARDFGEESPSMQQAPEAQPQGEQQAPQRLKYNPATGELE